VPRQGVRHDSGNPPRRHPAPTVDFATGRIAGLGGDALWIRLRLRAPHPPWLPGTARLMSPRQSRWREKNVSGE
jgi:hypothetical protein